MLSKSLARLKNSCSLCLYSVNTVRSGLELLIFSFIVLILIRRYIVLVWGLQWKAWHTIEVSNISDKFISLAFPKLIRGIHPELIRRSALSFRSARARSCLTAGFRFDALFSLDRRVVVTALSVCFRCLLAFVSNLCLSFSLLVVVFLANIRLDEVLHSETTKRTPHLQGLALRVWYCIRQSYESWWQSLFQFLPSRVWVLPV